MDTRELIGKLHQTHALTFEEWIRVIEGRSPDAADELFRLARETCLAHYGRDIYIRGLIEFTNYCRNDCYYCGIRKSNGKIRRYRLTEDVILACCRQGYELGFRTFVLQGGEDAYFTDARLTDLIRLIRTEFPDCAITLSVGERERASYQALFDAGADRYLLRHETGKSTEEYVHLRRFAIACELLKRTDKSISDIARELGYASSHRFCFMFKKMSGCTPGSYRMPN